VLLQSYLLAEGGKSVGEEGDEGGSGKGGTGGGDPLPKKGIYRVESKGGREGGEPLEQRADAEGRKAPCSSGGKASYINSQERRTTAGKEKEAFEGEERKRREGEEALWKGFLAYLHYHP